MAAGAPGVERKQAPGRCVNSDRAVSDLIGRPNMDTVVQVRTAQLEHHPSFPGGMPAIMAEPVEQDWCTDCAWLAGMIRAGRHVEAYGRLSLRHWYAIHGTTANRPSQTRHNSTGGAR